MSERIDYRDPSLRKHFVYRAYDKDGVLLYVGCSMNLSQRWKDHRANKVWAHLAVSFRLSGPYNYETGRRLEKEALATEQPLYAYTPLRWRAHGKSAAAGRRALAAALNKGLAFGEAVRVAANAERAERDRVMGDVPWADRPRETA